MASSSIVRQGRHVIKMKPAGVGPACHLFGLGRPHMEERFLSRSPVMKGKVSPRRKVPPHIAKPDYADTGRVPPSDPAIHLHGPESAKKLRAAARLARKMLDYACSLAKVGITTDQIDAAVHQAIIDHGAYPSPLNYMNFPKSICSSLNEVVVHGIPDDRPLQDGDIASFDVSLYLDGVHGDNCATVCVGNVDDDGRRLVEAARATVEAAVAVCRPGGCISDIGAAVEDVCNRYGVASVRQYSGHGIGYNLHMQPCVLFYRNAHEIPLRPGMIFTIEPMITEGSNKCMTWEDGWTVVTVDGGRGAQFEHTVMITETGVEVLTVPE